MNPNGSDPRWIFFSKELAALRSSKATQGSQQLQEQAGNDTWRENPRETGSFGKKYETYAHEMLMLTSRIPWFSEKQTNLNQKTRRFWNCFGTALEFLPCRALSQVAEAQKHASLALKHNVWEPQTAGAKVGPVKTSYFCERTPLI